MLLNSQQIFTPLVYRPAMWLDMTDPAGNSVIPANGSALASLVDKAGLILDITQAVAAQRAIYTHNAVNNKPALLFNGTTGQRYYGCTNPLLINAPGTTIFSVTIPLGSQGTRRCIIESTQENLATMPISQEYTNTNISKVFMGDGNNGSAVISVSGGSYSLGNPYLYRTTYNGGTTNAFNFVRNGVNQGSASRVVGGSTGANTGFNIGTYRDANSRWFDGYICEIICFARLLAANEIANIESYLNQKWNIL